MSCPKCMYAECMRLSPCSMQVRVVRDGAERRLSVFELLVGDVLVSETGDIVPTDGVVIEGSLK